MKIIQNRFSKLIDSRAARVKFYRKILDRRLAEVERGIGDLQVPGLRGLRLRLPGKPFHATPEFFFQEAGVTRFLLPEETLAIGAGKAALIPSGMPHAEIWKGKGFLSIVVMFQEQGYSFHLSYLEDRLLRCSTLDRFHSSARISLVRHAEEIATAGSTRTGKQVRCGLYLSCLARLREGLDSGACTTTNKHPLQQRCLELIEMHFTRMDLSVTWLAREIGCTPDHLSRLFHHETGRRLVSFIHQKRIDYASHLLLESDMNIAETAWACGFRQPSYFNRIFLAHTGLKPNQLRKSHADAVEFPRSPRSKIFCRKPHTHQRRQRG